MAYIINLPTYKDSRGTLSVFDKDLPFEVKRIYYIYNVSDIRGGHRHKKTIQALICVGGSCDIYLNDGVTEKTIVLDNPSNCLIVEPKDWHTMDNFSENAILLVISSEKYDRDDYIDEPYK